MLKSSVFNFLEKGEFMKIFFSFLILSISSQSLASSPFLIGGEKVKRDEYPEIIRIRSGNASCSASVVGPRILMTAGHCSKDSGEIEPISENLVYEFQVDQTFYKARCVVHPDYKSQQGDMDMALCKTDSEVKLRYASVSLDKPRMGDVVTLSGYGCTRRGGGGRSGVLKTGEALVVKETNEDYFSFHTRGDVALCFGDSGSPAFKRVKNPKKDHHYVLGVNSRADLQELSLMTAVYNYKARKFLKDFEQDQDVKICGVSLNCDHDEEEKSCGSELKEVKAAVEKLDQCFSNLFVGTTQQTFLSLP